jgi:hypothetical protein
MPTSSAAAASTSQYLPGLAETPGANGSYFRSEAVLYNPNSVVANVTLDFINATGTPVPSQHLSLMAGEDRRIKELLKFFVPAQVTGLMHVTSDIPIMCTSSTLNIADPSATFGLGFTAVLEPDVMVPGKSYHTIGAKQSVDYRTNINVTLLDPDNSVTINVYDKLNNVLKGTTTVTGGAHMFQAGMLNIVPGGLTLGRVEFIVNKGRAIAYTVVNDNVTSDGTAEIAKPLPTGNVNYLVNALANAHGSQGSYWSSSVDVYNPGTSSVTVTIELLRIRNYAGLSWSTNLKAGQVFEVSNFIPTMFSSVIDTNDVIAAANVTSVGGPIVFTAVTTNSDPLGIRPGTFSASIPISDWTPDELPLGRKYVFTGVSQSGSIPGNRSNLAVDTGSYASNTFNFALFTATGTKITSYDYTINAGDPVTGKSGSHVWQQRSVADWFSGVPIPDDAVIVITIIDGNGKFYISRVDNGSNDSVVFPPFTINP